MTEDREIIEMLRREAEEHTPDRLAQIEAARGSMPAGAPAEVAAIPLHRKAALISALSALLGIMLLLLILLPVLLHGGGEGTDLTTLVVSINPSAEFTLENGTVTRTRPLNRDAAVLLAGQDFTGKTAEEACLGFATLAGKRNLIGTDGVRIRVTGKDEKKITDGIHAALDTLFAVGELDDAALDGLMGSYDEDAMEKFDDYLFREYEGKREDFLARARELLESYPSDVRALDLSDRAAVEAFNRKYLALGEDLLVELDDDDDDDAEELREELLEECEELLFLMERDPEEAFEEMFEEFLEMIEEGYEDD